MSLEEQARSALQLAEVLFRDTDEKEKLLRVKPPAQAGTFDPGQPPGKAQGASGAQLAGSQDF